MPLLISLACKNARRSTLLAGASLLALSAQAIAAPAFAQDTTEASAETTAATPARIAARDIVVTASPLAKAPEDLATPVERLSRDDILSGNNASLGELLQHEPGISASSFARGASRPVIRGLDNFRVRIQENGLGLNGASALSEDHGVPIDPLSAERIEVIRGPAVLRYGSEAIGGVVNILNNRIPKALPEKTVTGEASGRLSSVDDGHQESLLLDGGAGNIAVHADAFNRNTQDYDTPQGEQRFTETESNGQAVGASYIADWGYFGASVSKFDSEYGIPAPENPASPITIEMEQIKYAAESEIDNLTGWGETLRLSGSYSDYTHDEVSGGAIGSRFDNEETELRAELLHPKVGPFEGAIGLQWYDRDLSAAGEGGELIAPSNTRRTAFFIFEETPLTSNLTLELGGRIEETEVDGTALDTATDTEFAASRDFTTLSGSAGLVAKLDGGFVLGGTVQAVERAPDALELFSKGPHEATETFEIGDPNLGEERAYSAEISLRKTDGPFRFETAAYYTDYDDFIFKRLTGETCDDDFASCTPLGAGSELDQVVFSQEDARFTGLELSAEWDAFTLGHGILGFDGQADYVRAKLDTGGNVPRIPPMRYGAGVYYKTDAIFTRLGFLRAEEQDDLGAGETETAGYTLLNADARYNLDLPDSALQLNLALEGRNLLDDDVRNHVSFKKNDVLQPGRDVRLVATLKF